MLLQSRSSQASPGLYTIFTNEDAKTAADKDVEKKVGCQTAIPGVVLIAPRSRCSLRACKELVYPI
jgi:hypothetical protein